MQKSPRAAALRPERRNCYASLSSLPVRRRGTSNCQRPARYAAIYPHLQTDLHRLLIAAALSEGETLIHRCTLSEDIHATARVLQALGRSVTFGEDCITVGGKLELDRHVRCCDCGESGSTLRFLVPVLAALGQSAVFTGKGRLPQRPMEPMLTRLREHGCILLCPPAARPCRWS